MAYFDKYGVEFSDDHKTLIRCPEDFEGEYRVPDIVTKIRSNAFKNCAGLTSVIFPAGFVGSDSLFAFGFEEDDYGIFRGCYKLQSINIIEGNSKYCSIDGVLYSCDKTTLIEYPKGKAGMYIIPDFVTRISKGAFCNCKELTSIRIPASVSLISGDAFKGCSLLHSIDFRGDIKSIKLCALNDCKKLSDFCIPEHTVVCYCQKCNNELINKMIEGTVVKRLGTTLISVENKQEGEFVVPLDITAINYSAFKDCKMINSIILPPNLLFIGPKAFSGCEKLTRIIIPQSVQDIEYNAFEHCPSLKEIVVPNGQLSKFKQMEGCKKLKNVIVEEKANTRSWDECVAEWEKCKQSFKSNKAIFDMIDAGSVPASFPPIGVCLTIAEYNQFKREKRDLNKIQGWCYSGKSYHATVRLFSHLPNNLNTTGVGNMIGLKTPRKGFYRIIDVLDDKERTLVCYYNYQDSDEFVEEEVEISSKPLYNKASIGPQDHLLKVGDILNVKEDVQLTEGTYDGEVYTAYKIIWDYKN